MSGMLDKMFLNFISSQLKSFKWIRGNVAVCTCNFCGDGHRGSRTRLYFYEDIKHSTYRLNYQCKNCGMSGSFHNFLKDFDPGSYSAYRLECFRDKHGRDPYQFFPTEEPVKEVRLEKQTISSAVKLISLPEDHICRKYVVGRLIPNKYLDYLMYTDNFQETIGEFKDVEYAKKMPADARLIIPFYSEFGELLCVQGRSLDPKSKMRYITAKKNDNVSKIFGSDMVNRTQEIRVCEGPIDSFFITNCLASADADLTKVPGDVYIFDNQYRNKDVCRHINKAIEAGFKVVLFPNDFPYKDINESIMEGVAIEEIELIIKQNTFQGLKAKLVFNKLKGC